MRHLTSIRTPTIPSSTIRDNNIIVVIIWVDDDRADGNVDGKVIHFH